jgi:hypothetical protein
MLEVRGETKDDGGGRRQRGRSWDAAQ